MAPINVILEKCTGCKLCVKACGYDAIDIIDKKAVINPDKCILCGACVDACPFDAIYIQRQTFEGHRIEEYSGIAVYAENNDGALAPVVRQGVGAARELKKGLGENIYAILLGHKVEHLAEELISYGVDQVWMVDDPQLVDYSEDVQARMVED